MKTAPPAMRDQQATAPRVSVLIPTYNYARFLPEALDSVLAQDFGDFEIVVLDDASTDGTREVLESYAARDARVRFHVHERNVGMVQNWNLCLQQARGQYVKYLFGDDKLARPDALRRLVALLDEHPRAVLAGSARQVVDAQSRVTELWDGFGQAGCFRSRDVMLSCLEENKNLIGEPSAVLFRRNAAGAGFDPAFRQVVDLKMWFELLQYGDFVYTPEALVCFRQHDTQQTQVNKRRGLEVEEVLFARYWMQHAGLLALGTPRLFYSQWRGLRKIRNHPEARALAQALSARLGRGEFLRQVLLHQLRRRVRKLARLLRGNRPLTRIA